MNRECLLPLLGQPVLPLPTSVWSVRTGLYPTASAAPSVCIVYCGSSVPARLGLALLCRQPGSRSHRLESTLRFTFSDSQGFAFTPHTASGADPIIPCDTHTTSRVDLIALCDTYTASGQTRSHHVTRCCKTFLWPLPFGFGNL